MTTFWSITFILVLVAASVRLVLVDLATQLIRNRDLITSGAVVALLSALMLATDPGSWHVVVRGLEASACLGLVYLVLAFISGGLGMGDIKLALLVGYLVGLHSWSSLVVTFEAAALIGGAVAAIALSRGRGRKQRVPYAPIMLAGAVIGAAFGTQLTQMVLTAIG